jgi:hypothetical protein
MADGDEAIGPNRVETAKAELAGLKEPCIDLDVDYAPVKPPYTRDSPAEQGLVVVVLDLEMMLAYKETLGPDWFRGHLREADEGAVPE